MDFCFLTGKAHLDREGGEVKNPAAISYSFTQDKYQGSGLEELVQLIAYQADPLTDWVKRLGRVYTDRLK